MARNLAATRTTTIRLPVAVYDQAKSVVAKGKTGASAFVSLNDLIVSALETYLLARRRQQIDAAFAGMSADAEYQRDATLLATDFAHSDWQALGLGEDSLGGEASSRMPRQKSKQSQNDD